MKCFFEILVLSAMVFAIAAPGYSAKWINALKPSGKTQTFVASKGNQAKCVILIPKDANATESKAADELRTWLGKIANVDIPIVKDYGYGVKTPVISVGETELAKQTDLGRLAQGIADEGYAIIAKDGNLFLIGGNRRGPLYAAYALLEEDLGVRWYTQRCDDVIPSMQDLVIKFVPRKYNPVFDTRMPGVYEAFEINWMLKNRINPFMFGVIPANLGGSTHALGGAHTFYGLLSPDQYWESHPEYFSEVNGKRQLSQLCLTNEDVAKIVTEKVKDMFRNSDARFVAISPMDGAPLCTCTNCKAIDDAEGTKMGALLTFLNKVAVGIKDEFPDRRILTLAYLDYYLPPKTIKAEPSITIQLCTDSHAWANPFCKIDETDKYRNALAGWRKTGADIVIWDYVNNYDHNLIPFPNMEVVDWNIKYHAKNGAGGIFLQGDCWSNGTDSGYMRAWVWAKLLWNPNLDVFKLMQDFIYGYYGPAADAIWEYEMLKEKLWSENHAKPHNVRTEPKTTEEENPLMVGGIRWQPNAKLYTDEFVNNSAELMQRALDACTDGGQIRKVNSVKLQIDYLRLCRGLGYYNSHKRFFNSQEVIDNDRTRFPEYEKILADLEATVKYENVTNFYEVYGTHDAPERIKKWHDLLKYPPIELPLVPFSHEWKFSTDPKKQGDELGYFKLDFDDSKWETMMDNIGYGWTSQGYPDYLGEAWYRQWITPPADVADKKHLFLFFGSVDEEAFVYINGKFAFERSFKSTGKPGEVIWNEPFMEDVKGLIKPGEPNLIVVKVNNLANAGGIWQPVHLLPLDEEIPAQRVFDNI